MIVFVLICVFIVCLARRAFLVGRRKLSVPQFWILFFWAVLSTGLAAGVGMAMQDPRYSVEQLGLHALSRVVGLVVVSGAVSAVSWVIGWFVRPKVLQ